MFCGIRSLGRLHLQRTHFITMSFTAQVASVENSSSVSFRGQTQKQPMSVAHWFAKEGADSPGALKVLRLFVLRVQCLLSAWTEDWAKQGVEWMYTLRNEFYCETTPSQSALSVNQALDFQVSLCISVTKNKGSISMSYSRKKRAVPLCIYETAGLYTFNSSDMTIKQLEQLPWQRRVWWKCDISPALWGGGEPQWTQGQGHTTCPHLPLSTQND